MSAMKPIPVCFAHMWNGKRYSRLDFAAHTKSEARALAKAELGIPRKERLPVGIVFERAKG